MHTFQLFKSRQKAQVSAGNPHPMVHLEALENRTLMSAGASPVHSAIGAVEAADAAASSYEFTVNSAISLPSHQALAHSSAALMPVSAPRQEPWTLEYGEEIVTGKYLLPMRADHAGRSAETSRGEAALSTQDTHTYAGRPPKSRLLVTPSDAPRVLVIEDDPISRNALASVLRHRGWQVSTAATATEGLRKLAADPDCVVVDLMLPDGEGESILKQIQFAHLHSRVTVMTGVGDPDRLARVADLHPDAILSKPVNLTQLLDGLNAGLQN